MDLIDREVTEAMEKANGENSQKSTGPKTEQGKRNARWNAFRHGVFGRELCPWTEELDEEAADYQRFCQRYRDTFQVRDEVEGLLVRDMAEIRWRLKKLLRAESACLAWQRTEVGERAAPQGGRRGAGDGRRLRADGLPEGWLQRTAGVGRQI